MRECETERKLVCEKLLTPDISSAVKPFIIGNDLVNLVVKKGQTIKYDIKYGGEPEPEVRWLLNTTEIKEDAQER